MKSIYTTILLTFLTITTVYARTIPIAILIPENLKYRNESIKITVSPFSLEKFFGRVEIDEKTKEFLKKIQLKTIPLTILISFLI